MEKLCVIFANRKDCFEKPGGDTVQMLKTKEYLEKLFPVNIKICLSAQEILEDKEAQIVHIFNIQTVDETNAFIKVAKSQNKKIVLSTIYWNLLDAYYVKYLRFLNINPINIPDFCKRMLVCIFNFLIKYFPFVKNKFIKYFNNGLYGTKEYKLKRKQAIMNSDLLLPNSEEEAFWCAKDFGIDCKKIMSKTVVVPNAIEWKNINKITSRVNNINNISLPEKYVVCAARLNPDKNQSNILKALVNERDIGIVFVGGAYNCHYQKLIKHLANKRGNVYILPHIDQDKLFTIYSKAICHVLASYRESPGLATLEALNCNTQIVFSDKKYCPIEYYEFEKYGYKCNPYKISSIRKAIYNAINNPKNNEISEEYKDKFSYTNVAKLTYGAYKQLLESVTKK